MNCLDCARDRHLLVSAVAACIDCGAGGCEDHLVVCAHHLTRTEPLLRQGPGRAPRAAGALWHLRRRVAGRPPASGSRTRTERRSA